MNIKIEEKLQRFSCVPFLFEPSLPDQKKLIKKLTIMWSHQDTKGLPTKLVTILKCAESPSYKRRKYSTEYLAIIKAIVLYL